MKADFALRLSTVLASAQARPLTCRAETEVTGCYISDLLSDVLAHAHHGMLWLTIQTHRNVVACATATDIDAILITCGRQPRPDVVAEAEQNGIILLSTPLSTYEAAGRLWEAGLR